MSAQEITATAPSTEETTEQQTEAAKPQAEAEVGDKRKAEQAPAESEPEKKWVQSRHHIAIHTSSSLHHVNFYRIIVVRSDTISTPTGQPRPMKLVCLLKSDSTPSQRI